MIRSLSDWEEIKQKALNEELMKAAKEIDKQVLRILRGSN